MLLLFFLIILGFFVWLLLRVRKLEDELARLRAQFSAGAPAAPVSQPAIVVKPPEAATSPAAEAEPPQPPPTVPDAVSVPAPRRGSSFEEMLTVRWAVWAGGVALALAGIFLVRYSIDQGWLGPAARVSLGLLLGAAFLATSERARRHPTLVAAAAGGVTYIAPALAAAGLVAGFASLYTAYALYDLLGPLVAFAGLSLVSAGAVAMSLLHGPFIALIGICGAFVVPLLVASDEPSAWALFPYLIAVAAGALWVVRYRRWWWLGWVALWFACVWPLLWILFGWTEGDALAVGVYLVALAGLIFFVADPVDPSDEPARSDAPWPAIGAFFARIGGAGAAAIAVLVFVLIRMDSYGPAALATAASIAVLYLYVARARGELDLAAVTAALLTVGLLAAWHFPQFVPERPPFGAVTTRGFTPGPLVAPELSGFLAVAVGFGVLYAFGGFALLSGARHPARWACLSAGAPLAILAVAYWRITEFETSLPWAAAALGLAALSCGAAIRVAPHRDGQGMEAALAAYALGACAGLAAALVMTLQAAWLTVALALLLPALAWIHGETRVAALRWAALFVATIVLIRLLLNPYVLDYPIGPTPIFNWLLYGYGVPALAFAIAAAWFGRERDDPLVMTLEAGTVVFAVVLATLEIRHLFSGGPLATGDHGLAEQALRAAVWLLGGWAMFRLHRVRPRAVLHYGWRILALLALAQVVVLNLIFSNPLFTDDPVGDWPLVNLISLAYLLPAAIGAAIAYEAWRQRQSEILAIAVVAVLALGFVDISLEVRRAFHGAILSQVAVTAAELYAYSAAWLIYGGALLAAGIVFAQAGLRWASLAVIVLAVLKVFLIDMAELEGLFRVASFLGLGLALVGIGFLYQRFIFPPAAKPATAESG
ncbi:MAG TPA: DUF2339 domain-containing protein [Alphaproteobacteria bacterium]|nr:DUF2339 domain-containing protein [Alphaproteobacteria bacterium]